MKLQIPARKRKYQIIWERIKKDGKCTIEVHPALQARVKKAIKMEKYKDLGFKCLNDHDYFFLKMKHPVVNGVEVKERLECVLKQHFGLEGVVRDD